VVRCVSAQEWSFHNLVYHGLWGSERCATQHCSVRHCQFVFSPSPAATSDSASRRQATTPLSARVPWSSQEFRSRGGLVKQRRCGRVDRNEGPPQASSPHMQCCSRSRAAQPVLWQCCQRLRHRSRAKESRGLCERTHQPPIALTTAACTASALRQAHRAAACELCESTEASVDL
jgi:hypothetical protein